MVALLALLLALPLPILRAQEEAPDEPDARLSAVSGSVYHGLAAEDGAGFVAAEKDAPISEGDHIRTGMDGRATLTFDDESVVELGPNTDFIAAKLGKTESEFFLGIGSLVAKLKKLGEGREVRFRTPTSVAAVRGTELAITQESDDKAVVGVFDEGQVSVTAAEGGEPVLLGPNQELEWKRGGPTPRARRLESLEARRDLLQRCRRRLEHLRRTWHARPFGQRLEFRRHLQGNPHFDPRHLRRVPDSMRGREYPELRREMRRRVQENRERREEIRRHLQERKHEQHEKRDQHRREQHERRDERDKRHEEKREEHRQGAAPREDQRRWAAGPWQPQMGAGQPARPRKPGAARDGRPEGQ